MSFYSSTTLLIVTFCLLQLSTQLPQWAGFAEKDCVCTSEYQPVCASDLRRYRNICTYNCRLDYLRKNHMMMIERVSCKTLPPAAPTP
ncbi:uncharacterized protein isoform X1 [Choristoneura fumiferana]|uniref:uncharacterized protein isoform X1 n=1 Tax=Choristoneura fumiferana TaxID=7141 RepID=UPI003D15C839